MLFSLKLVWIKANICNVPWMGQVRNIYFVSWRDYKLDSDKKKERYRMVRRRNSYVIVRICDGSAFTSLTAAERENDTPSLRK